MAAFGLLKHWAALNSAFGFSATFLSFLKHIAHFLVDQWKVHVFHCATLYCIVTIDMEIPTVYPHPKCSYLAPICHLSNTPVADHWIKPHPAYWFGYLDNCHLVSGSKPGYHSRITRNYGHRCWLWGHPAVVWQIFQWNEPKWIKLKPRATNFDLKALKQGDLVQVSSLCCIFAGLQSIARETRSCARLPFGEPVLPELACSGRWMKTLIENGHYRRSQHEAEDRASRIKCWKKNETLGGKMEEGGRTGTQRTMWGLKVIPLLL